MTQQGVQCSEGLGLQHSKEFQPPSRLLAFSLTYLASTRHPEAPLRNLCDPDPRASRNTVQPDQVHGVQNKVLCGDVQRQPLRKAVSCELRNHSQSADLPAVSPRDLSLPFNNPKPYSKFAIGSCWCSPKDAMVQACEVL